MKVRFLNLSIEDEKERKALLTAIDRVFQHGQIVLGPEVEEFEQKVAAYCRVNYAVAVNSGTDALYLALRSIGIGAGDEVITSCLSWIATANAIALTGARPVFADIKEDLNIDAAKVEALITTKTKAILPVHFTGKICDMAALQEIADKHKLMVVEDASQAFGASYHGSKAGSLGRVSAYSLNPMKVLAACGEAGVLLTDEEAIYERLKALRYNGTPDKTEAHFISLNARMDTVQAAILLQRLPMLEEHIARRRAAAAYYNARLHELVKTPVEAEDCRDVFYTYQILCNHRDELQEYLAARGIETKVQHSLLMPLHRAYRAEISGSWPIGTQVCNRSLCLPLHEKISRTEQDYVIKSIHNFYKSSSAEEAAHGRK